MQLKEDLLDATTRTMYNNKQFCEHKKQKQNAKKENNMEF